MSGKVKQFSHTDYDGVGCVIMAKNIFAKEGVDYTLVDYDRVDKEVTDFLSKYVSFTERFSSFLAKATRDIPFTSILITDISVNEKTAEYLSMFSFVTGVPCTIIDHHATAIKTLEEYKWAHVHPERDGKKTSGTSEMYEILVKNNKEIPENKKVDLYNFAECARLYDTWEWFKDQMIMPKTMNSLLYLYGRNNFIERFTNNLTMTISPSEEMTLAVEEERNNRYIYAKVKEIKKISVCGHMAGVVFAENNLSALGNKICTENPDIEFSLVISMAIKAASLRTVKDDFDLGKFAKENFGGGGHPKAAGFEINDKTYNFFEALFQKLLLDK